MSGANNTTEYRVSVVLCAYTQKRWQNLVDAVASLHMQTHPAHEIIVVIDHNPSLLKQAQTTVSGVKVIDNKEEQGLSGARNSGLAFAQGELIAFLDDDAVAQPDWLASMCEALHDPAILGVGSRVIPQWEQQKKPDWLPAEFYWVVGCTYTGMPEVKAPVRNPIGASMCIRSEVFQQVGGFRQGIGRIGTLPIGCEETELCIRARQHWPEKSFVYLPHTSVAHFVPQSRMTWRYFLTRCYAEGISKATISRFVGARDSLSAESAYTLKVLPAGILRALKNAVLCGRINELARAVAIVVGLFTTAAGYVHGKYPFVPAKKR